MRLKREEWIDEDHEIAQLVLFELSKFDSERWVVYKVIFKPLGEYFPKVSPRHIAQIVCELNREKKLILHIKPNNVFLQKMEEYKTNE